ncbi:MAG TPA: nuclear transport factor 2 family protein [Steroidobacteraceae bacterium]|nr:nuclear transport factor 2 family protein [Steroidobacteraceae bacterium]
MNDTGWLQGLLRTIDAKDAAAFAGFLTPDASFRFGNSPAVRGREAIETVVRGFFDAIDALAHELDEQWSVGEVTICTGTVTYTRRDGRSLRAPFANVLKRRAGRIYDYQIFVDNSALFAP